MSQANTGLGTTLKINTGTSGSPTWTLVGELTDTPLSGRKVDTTDTTNFQSTAKEFKATIVESGNVKVTGNYLGTDAGQLALEAAFESLKTTQFQVTLPVTGTQGTSGDIWTFSAVVEELSPFGTLSPTKVVSFQASLKVTGSFVVTRGS